MTVASKGIAPPEEQAAAHPAPKRSQAETLASLRKVWPWVFLIAMLVFFTIASKQMNDVNFLTPRALQGILLYSTLILIVGLAETFVIITGGIDLSVGWTLGFSAVIGANIMEYLNTRGMPQPQTIVLGMLGGVAVSVFPGLLNGILIAKVRVPSLISTLGVGFLVEGIALIQSNGFPIANQPPILGDLGNGSILHFSPGNWLTFFSVPAGATQAQLQANIPLLPNTVLVTIIVTVICWFILAKTQFGQHIYAIGGNPEAANRAGIPVQWTLIKMYILASVLAGVAGVVWAARFTSGAFNAGETTLMNSIAAVVLGGASTLGGEGSVVGTTIGALIIATIIYGLVVLGVLAFTQFVIVGIVLILALVVDQFGRNLGK